MIRPAAILASALIASLATPALARDEPQTPGGKEALDILKEAIEVPTVAGRGNVPKLAEKLKARFLAGGFTEADIKFTPVGETGFLTVRYPGRDRKAKPLVVIAHMDVVEARPEDWERDPFKAIIENGYIFGRGSDDDKSGVAMASAAFLKLKREGWVPARDVVLGFSGDEETSMASTKAMAQALANADLVLNVDAGGGMLSTDNKPLFFGVQAGEKTYADYTLTTTDAGGHSSRPGSVDVIAEMGAALDAIWKHTFTPKLSPLTKAYLEGSAGQVADPKIARAMRDFIADQSNAEAIATLSAEPEWIGVIRTTCVPTMINGGHAPNALPQSVTANVNCRIFPGTSRDDVQAELGKIVANPKITIAFKDNGTLESIESPLDKKVMDAVTKAVHENVPGLAVIPNMSAGATDSMHFRSQGIRAYGVTPIYMRSEDSFAHGLNERLPLATLDPGVRQMESMLKSLAK